LAIASTGFAVLRSIDEDLVLPDYFFHALRFGFCTMQFDQRSSGGNYPAITKDDLKKTIIPVPLPDVQKRIVAELDAAYEAKRNADEKATRLLASIDEIIFSELGIPPLPPQDTSIHTRMFTVLASEIFESRFDAIAYQNLRREFLKSVEHSWYACLPLATLVDVNRQQTNNLNGQQYIGLENIDGTTGDFMPTQDKESCSSAVVFKAGDILFPKLRPYLNKVWLATFNGVASTEFYPLHAKTEDAAYLTAYLRTKAVANVMTLLMTGNTLPRVQLEDILSLPVPVPPHAIQHRIVEKVTAFREEAKRLKSDATESLAASKSRLENQLL
jgi:restriction endonuclease S subunit